MTHNESLSQILKQERTRHSLTQEDVARRVGCDTKTVGRWERGLTIPTSYYRQKLMKLYGKSAEELGLLEEVTRASHSTQQVEQQSERIAASQLKEPASWQVDWGEAPSIDNFCGCEKELDEVAQWMIVDRCRIISVLGIGGVGKTTFATKVARDLRVADIFEYVFWRSLQQAPPLTYILESCLQFIGLRRAEVMPNNPDEQLSLLITILREHRCLILLDNVESVLQAGQRTGLYRAGYEGYGRFFQRIGQSDHQSCLLLTSREKTKELAHMEGSYTSPVRSLTLRGLAQADGQRLLKEKALYGSDESWNTLVHRFAGNPLALKVVSEPIREVFGGDIAAFLQASGAVFGEMFDLLDQQFQRLSSLEREVMYWLAIEREGVLLQDIQADKVGAHMRRALLDALDSLRRRSIIEISSGNRFTLQPVIMDYVTEKMVEQVYEELEAETLELFGSHALMKAQSNDYVREGQIRFILAPLCKLLLAKYGEAGCEKKLKSILAMLHAMSPRMPNYAAGNLLNLLVYLRLDLRGYDFSQLMIQQASFLGVELPEIDFTAAHFASSVFTETFTSILCVALSPGGNLLAVGTTTGEVLLRQADDLTPLYTCLGHADGVRSVAFNSEGTLLASGSEDQTICLWDTHTGRCLRVLKGHANYVRSVAFNPEGTLLASGSEDQTIRVWNVKTGECLCTLLGHTHWVRSIAFSPVGDLLASGSNDQTTRLWDAHSWQCLHILPGHTGYVRSVAFSLDGMLLASGSEDQTIRLWDTHTGQYLTILQGHTARVRSVCFHPYRKLLASGSDDKTIRLWDTRTGQCLNTWYAHINRIWSIAFFPHGKHLVSVSEDETMRYWEIPGGRCLRKLQGYTSLVKSVAYHPNGQIVASGNEDQAVRLWDVDTEQCLGTLRGHVSRVRTVAFSHKGAILASGSEDETVRLWDIKTGQCLKHLQGHTHLVRSIAFNANDSILASGGHDQTIRLWEVNTGRCLNILDGKGGLVWSVAFSSDGKLLASGSEDQIVRIWDANTGRCLKVLEGHTHRVWSVAFHPQNYVIASSSDDQTVRLWDAMTGQNLNTLRGHTSWVRTLAVSPDGNLLASGSHDRMVRLWDMSTGQCLNVLQGHSSSIWSVAFSPDGRFVASGSDDGTIRIWNLQADTCISTLRSDRPYERMNITGVTGLTQAQRASLKMLGAITSE